MPLPKGKRPTIFQITADERPGVTTVRGAKLIRCRFCNEQYAAENSAEQILRATDWMLSHFTAHIAWALNAEGVKLWELPPEDSGPQIPSVPNTQSGPSTSTTAGASRSSPTTPKQHDV